MLTPADRVCRKFSVKFVFLSKLNKLWLNDRTFLLICAGLGVSHRAQDLFTSWTLDISHRAVPMPHLIELWELCEHVQFQKINCQIQPQNMSTRTPLLPMIDHSTGQVSLIHLFSRTWTHLLVKFCSFTHYLLCITTSFVFFHYYIVMSDLGLVSLNKIQELMIL